MICSICKCTVTAAYSHPLGDGSITCWFHADYFYVTHPERFAAALKRYWDVPNLSDAEKITLDISKTT